MQEMTRREALLGTVSAGAFGLAGCIAPDGADTAGGDDSGTDGSDGNTTAGSGTDGSDGTVDDQTTAGATVTTTGTDCGSADDESVAVAVSEDTLTVRGVTPAPDPCHEAVLDTAAVADGELSLTVGVETTDEEACIGCTGRVDYEATVELDGADVERVTVDHTEGSEMTVPRDEFVDEFPSPEVRSATIETTGTSCGSGDEGTAEIERDGDAVVVTGTLSASNPCHEAVLGDLSVSDGVLSVPVGVQSAGSGGCATCLGVVEYTARIELDDSGALDSVRIDHEGGGTFGAGWEEDQSR